MNDNLLQRFLVLSALIILLTNIFIPVSANFIEKPLIMNRVEEINDEFDQTIIDYMNNGHLPSMALAIVKNNIMVWSKGYGYADIKNKNQVKQIIESGRKLEFKPDCILVICAFYFHGYQIPQRYQISPVPKAIDNNNNIIPTIV